MCLESFWYTRAHTNGPSVKLLQAVCIARAEYLPAQQIKSKLVLLEENASQCVPLVQMMRDLLRRIPNIAMVAKTSATAALLAAPALQPPSDTITVTSMRSAAIAKEVIPERLGEGDYSKLHWQGTVFKTAKNSGAAALLQDVLTFMHASGANKNALAEHCDEMLASLQTLDAACVEGLIFRRRCQSEMMTEQMTSFLRRSRQKLTAACT